MTQPAPRVTPGNRQDVGLLNNTGLNLAMRVMKLHSGNLFTTMARQRRMFRAWLRFGGTLMPRGSLPRRETELVILRVAHRRNCTYEFGHHRRISQKAGVTTAEVERIQQPLEAGDWSAREFTLLRAADSIHETQNIDDALWAELARLLPDKQLVEFTMLVAHYEMLATFISTLRIQDDLHK